MGACSSSTKIWVWMVVLEWFNYPCTTAYPRCKDTKGYWIDLHHCFTHALSRPGQRWRKLYYCQAYAVFVTCKFLAASEECCEQGYGHVCVKLYCRMLWCLKRTRNDHSYLCMVSGLTFHCLQKYLAWWAVTWRTSKNHKAIKIGGGHLPRTIWYLFPIPLFFTHSILNLCASGLPLSVPQVSCLA